MSTTLPSGLSISVQVQQIGERAYRLSKQIYLNPAKDYSVFDLHYPSSYDFATMYGQTKQMYEFDKAEVYDMIL